MNKADHLVTHRTYAYRIEYDEVNLITDHDVMCRLLRECSCKGKDTCQHHRNRQHVAGSEMYQYEFEFEYELRQCFYRYYQLHDRTLMEVLDTQSVRSEIKELVSAIANSGGGKILLGATNSFYQGYTYIEIPHYQGYTLDDSDVQQLKEYLSAIIDTCIWSTVEPREENWKLFVNPVPKSAKCMIEIRVRKCIGGMFCSMPACFGISHSGDILAMNTFEDWKKEMLDTFILNRDKIEMTLEEHLKPDKVGGNAFTVPMAHDAMSDATGNISNVDCAKTPHIFSWWLCTPESLLSESLCFHDCCGKDLADGVIDMMSPFAFFPSIEAVVERNRDVHNLSNVLAEIGSRYENGKGAGCVIENILNDPNPLVQPSYHVCDVVVLREKQRPSIISVVEKDCDETDARQYSTALACFLKSMCLLTCKDSCNDSIHLSFMCQLYVIGDGFKPLEERIKYPKEYLQPKRDTLDIVRYMLARIFLHCEPLKDRFGDIIIRHLSACQARVLWNKWKKVNVVEGKAGSGKSILILETMRRVKQEQAKSRILFLCRGRGLAAFVKYQTEMMGVSAEIHTIELETIKQMTKEYFMHYTNVFIDDAHALPVSGDTNCQTMYDSLFSSLCNRDSHVYIFMDPEMQDYRGCIPVNFSRQIGAMARKYPFLRQEVRIEVLGKVLRNSHRICQFINSNIPDGEIGYVQGTRNLPNDNVFFSYIAPLFLPAFDLLLERESNLLERESNLSERGSNTPPLLPDYDVLLQNGEDSDDHHDHSNDSEYDKSESDESNFFQFPFEIGHTYDHYYDDSPEDSEPFIITTIVTCLKKTLSANRYHERDITILTETEHQKMVVLDTLRYDRFCTQDASTFPVKHIVVDELQNFEGLESPVILFVVPESWGTSYIGSLKYRLCIATRAISRLEFLVPWHPTVRQQDLAALKRAFRTEVKVLCCVIFPTNSILLKLPWKVKC